MKIAAQGVHKSASASSSSAAWLSSAWSSLRGVWNELQALDPRAHEDLVPDDVRALRDRVRRVFGEARALAADLMARCDRQLEAVERDASPHELSTSGMRTISDVCFVALAETGAKRAQLERDDLHADPFQSLCISSSVLRRLRKVLTCMDAELACMLSSEPFIEGSALLSESLEVRKQYSLLRRAAAAESRPQPSELHSRLRAIAMRIGMLREREIYRRLRLDDRVELGVVHRRIEQWFSGAREAADGVRIWTDAAAFMHILTQVNLRQELREHDAHIVRSVLCRLESREDGGVLSNPFWDRLKGLMGLHDGLDDLLRRDERDPEQCRRLLRVLSESFKVAPPARAGATDERSSIPADSET